MSRIIASAAIRGAYKYIKEAEEKLNKMIEEKGPDQAIGFPNTAYYLPLILAILGIKVETLADAKRALEQAKSLLPPPVKEKLWLPYLGDTLDAGIATLIAEEIIEALKYLTGDEPKGIWLGFTDDATLRMQGIKLVDGRMPGFAACVGALPTNEQAVELARSLQEKNILVFMASSAGGKSMAEQLAEEGIEMNWDTFLVPYGKDTSAAVLALNFAVRAALTFGGIKPEGPEKAREIARKILLYNKERVHAFVLALGKDPEVNGSSQLITDEKYATAAGAINFGFPILSDVDIPQILPTGICTYEHVVSSIPLDKIVSKAIEVRGLEIKVTEVPIPVPYGAGFEGERVRKEQMQVEFGGKRSVAFELLRGRPMDEVEDGKIQIIGPDVDSVEEGSAMPLGILVEVAGRNFSEDFETVLERRIHEFLSCANGIFHMGQRAIAWIRISKEAYQKGFRLRHFGEILIAKLHDEYSRIVDKVQVTLITDEEKMKEPLEEAKRIYHERDERLGGMTDEDVDTFYSCILCQSYAPDHVCIVTPERLGLCGAYTWLDCKASYRLNPHGPNEPVKKGRCLDPIKGQWEGVNEYPIKGQWEGVNEYLKVKSNGNLKKFNAYSMLEDPMTSCVVGDTEVVIDGKPVKIGDFVNRHWGKEDYAKSSALTLEKGKAKEESIVAIQRFPAPKRLVKLHTKSGVKLILTPDHKIAVDRWEKLGWVRADEIKVGDRIISLAQLDLPSDLPKIVDILPDDFRVADQDLIKKIKGQLITKYGSLRKALTHIPVKISSGVKSIKIGDLKAVASYLGMNWKKIKEEIKVVNVGSSFIPLPEKLSEDIFYLMGLIASDGSITKRGKYEYRIDFINTNEKLGEVFASIYSRNFSGRNIGVVRRRKTVSRIRGRIIKPNKTCLHYYLNNPVLGYLCKYFGIPVDYNARWNLGKMLDLPRAHIAAFLAGLFDGDGSVRLRRYQDKWEVGEGYLCIFDEDAARHLQLLLKRLGIAGNLRKDKSVWKIELHGRNLSQFALLTSSRHPRKRELLVKISQLSGSKNRLDKSQREVLPYHVGRAVTGLAVSGKILSPTTLFYYKTGRSRPVASNVQKVLQVDVPLKQKEKKFWDVLEAALNTDYYLDTVIRKEEIENEGRYDYVYNLTLKDVHAYFVNGGPLIKNCGCFEL